MALPSERSLKRKASYGDFVTVCIGEDKKEFKVHEDVLKDDSKYFRAAFNGEFSEAKTKTVHLPDIEPATFKTYVHWMYSNDIVFNHASGSDIEDGKTLENYYEGVVKLYLAADRLENKHLRNCVMTVAVARAKEGIIPGILAIEETYNRTLKGDLLRRFIVDARLAAPVPSLLDFSTSYQDKLPQDFVFE